MDAGTTIETGHVQRQPPSQYCETTIETGHAQRQPPSQNSETTIDTKTHPVCGSERRSMGVQASVDSGAAESCMSLRTA